MRIIGDVHGHIGAYLLLVERAEGQPTFQVGDMAVGFQGVNLPKMSEKNRFIRGNHDSPSECRKHPNYAGDYGYDEENRLFYLGGAWSIDQKWRTEGVSWWRDEELSYEELEKAADLYWDKKPEIVVTHDCPEEIGKLMVSISPSFYIIGVEGVKRSEKIGTRTGHALQRMWEEHKPKKWIFGHYHQDRNLVARGTEFTCLNELSFVDL